MQILHSKKIRLPNKYWEWVKLPDSELIQAEVVCEINFKTNNKSKVKLPVNLYLSPDKPVIDILKIQQSSSGSYAVEFKIKETLYSAPHEGKYTVTAFTGGEKTREVQTWGYYYGDNLFFTSPNDGFNITTSNHFGTVISDLISPQTFPKKKLKKQNHSISVFPKQAKNKLFIKDNSKKYTASVSIIDTNGKLIKKHAVAIDKKKDIDTSYLPKGNYILQIQKSTGETFSFPFQKYKSKFSK